MTSLNACYVRVVCVLVIVGDRTFSVAAACILLSFRNTIIIFISQLPVFEARLKWRRIAWCISATEFDVAQCLTMTPAISDAKAALYQQS